MPADRCYVGAIFNGSEQFYQREMERKSKDGRWEAVPHFVLNRSEAITMSEAAAKMFVARLRSLRIHSAFVEDARDGRRIEFASESSQSGEDNRRPMAATLDDENTYVIRPANTPQGPKWFLRIDIPGAAEPQVIHADEPIAVLQRAADLDYLKYAVKHDYKWPQLQQAPAPAPPTNSRVVRRRPGDQ
jgi:hypothetical protein